MASEEMEDTWPAREEQEGEEENIITPIQQHRPAYTPVKGPKWFPNMVKTLIHIFIIRYIKIYKYNNIYVVMLN